MANSIADSEDPEKIYRYVRHELDSMPEIQSLHLRRRELQDRLWSRVAEDIESDRDRLTQIYESNLQSENQGKLELNPEFDYPSHQLKVDIHRMPGGYLQDRNESDLWTGAIYDLSLIHI